MNVDFCIIPECYTDTNLIETIAPPLNNRGYNHQMGCNKVSSKMQDLKDCFALGIVDKDKKQIKYLNEFDEIANEKHIHLFKHKNKHHYIIQISPAIELFIIDTAKEVNLDLYEYGLSFELDELKKVTKRKTKKKDQQLSKLFRTFLNQKASEFVLLSKWIMYLIDHTYQSDIEILKQL